MTNKEKSNEEDIILNYLLNKHNFTYVSVLGKGGFGSVYSINVNENNFAYKIVRLHKKKGKIEEFNKAIKSIEKEFNYAKLLRGKYCIRTLSIFKDESEEFPNTIAYSAVMENALYSDLKYFIYYFYKGNLLHLNNYKKYFKYISHLNMTTIRFFAYQIIQSLDFLENHNLCHCDFKPENFLISLGFILKISDFSLLKVVEKNKKVKLTSSTWNIKAPEYYTSTKEIKSEDAIKVDIYGFGLILYYMLTYKHLLDPEDKEKLSNKEISSEEKFEYLNKKLLDKSEEIKNFENVDQGLKNLIIECINPEISKRPNVENLLENDWVNENIDEINQVYDINDHEEIKLFIEFQKTSNKNNNKFKNRKRKKNLFFKKKKMEIQN